MMRRYFIKTFGCQMNVADSELMAGILEARGLERAAGDGEADLILVNTCTIRQKAAEKAYSELGRFIGRKKKVGGPLVVAAGCVARKDGEGLRRRLPALDIILGPSRVSRLGELLEERLATGRAVMDIGDAPAARSPVTPARRNGITAFVNIMQGCDNRCAYCVVPQVRGPEISRPPAGIITEVADLAERGYREVTLLGQNVNAYGKGLETPLDFPDLLEALDRRTGITRLRFTTSHPKDFGERLTGAVRDLASVCEWVHLPVQAGSDRVLAAMNRGYSGAGYREQVARLREAVPDATVTTDIIVGFPGETEEDFEETLRLLREVRFSSIFAFKFSPREETPAAARPDDVPSREKERRLQAVLDLQKRISLELNRQEVGKIVEVLVEGPSKSGRSLVTGRSRGNRVVNFPGDPSLQGRLVKVTITRARQNSLLGRYPS